jgi:hypothetical protein
VDVTPKTTDGGSTKKLRPPELFVSDPLVTPAVIVVVPLPDGVKVKVCALSEDDQVKLEGVKVPATLEDVGVIVPVQIPFGVTVKLDEATP